MSHYLVTGGTGFLGGEIVSQLLAEGHKVTALCRRVSADLERAGAQVVVGDVLDRDSLTSAMRGIECVFHLAGLVSRDSKDKRRMMEVHVDGTRNVIETAVSAGIPKAVVSSSSGTIAVSETPRTFTERDPYAVAVAAKWAYYASKIYQEKLSFDLGKRLGLDVVCVNPSLLLGPGDKRLSSVGDVRSFLKREIPFTPKGGVNFVDVRDAAAGTIACARQGRAGERYFLGGPNWTMKEFFGRLARVAKVDAPMLSIPTSWAKSGAGLMRRVSRMAGGESKMSPVAVDMASHFWYLSSVKAQRELGFTCRDPGLTLADTVADLKNTL